MRRSPTLVTQRYEAKHKEVHTPCNVGYIKDPHTQFPSTPQDGKVAVEPRGRY